MKEFKNSPKDSFLHKQCAIMLKEKKTKWFSGQVEEKRSFIINGIAQENEVRKPLVDFLGCVRLCKPGKNGRFRPLWPLLVVVAH